MKFDYICEKFSEYELEQGNEQGADYISIMKCDREEPQCK